jgi:hypothetical protein
MGREVFPSNALAISGGREAAVRLHRPVGRHRRTWNDSPSEEEAGLLTVHEREPTSSMMSSATLTKG